MTKTMYFGTIIGIVIAFLFLSLFKGEAYWEVLLPITASMFAGNAIAAYMYRKKA